MEEPDRVGRLPQVLSEGGQRRGVAVEVGNVEQGKGTCGHANSLLIEVELIPSGGFWT